MPYHHYIPAFHLAEFTVDRHRDATICVTDLQQRKRWQVPVRRAGGESGYNAVHGVTGLDSEAIEQVLSRFESAAAPVVRTVNNELVLPSGEGLRVLLNHVALLSVNNPARRGAMNDSQARALYFMARQMIADRETFDTAQAECIRDGVPLLGEVSYEELRILVESGTMTYAMPNLAHIQGLGNLVDYLVTLLQRRSWSLLISPPGATDFICGDRPVVLTWSVERQRQLETASPGQPIFAPGFSSPNTELVVHLGRGVGLLGTHGGKSSRILADERIVAETNGRMVGQATRFVYSPEPTFTFRDGHNVLRSSEVLWDVPKAR